MGSTVLEKVKRATLAMQRYSWEQGTVAQAFLEAGDTQTAILMAVEGANRQIEDGRCAQIGETAAVTDHQPQFWVDSFYMLPPMLARGGYFSQALQQIDGYWKALFDEDKQLLSHIWDDGARRFIRKDAWGVGNGWAVAGMTRVIGMLPENYVEQKQKLIGRVKTILDAALRYQRSAGLFHDVLDNADSFREVNCGQMFAYAIYRGVKAGWLDAAYVEKAERIYAAVQAEVDRFGLVRNVCGMPTFDHPGVAPEGQAFYILMETARSEYLQ